MSTSNFNSYDFIRKKFKDDKKFWESAEKSLERELFKKKEKNKKSGDYKKSTIEAYFRRLSQIFEKGDSSLKEIKFKSLKRWLFRKFIIKKENIPKDYIQKEVNNLKNIYPQEPEDKLKEKVIDRIIQEQKESLEIWIEYLSSNIQHYPKELLYWIFTQVLKLGSYNYQKNIFNQRTPNTISPFPPCNPQALGIVIEQLYRKFSNRPPNLILPPYQRNIFLEKLQKENFNKLYYWTLEYVKSLKNDKERFFITSGEWKLFSVQDHIDNSYLFNETKNELVKALKEFNTGWCIDEENTAIDYLASNNILIYFSKDDKGEATIPRVVIIYSSPSSSVISDESIIYEIRGVAENQNLDPYISEVVEKKLQEFPEKTRQKYQKILEDIKKLNEIYFKFLNNQELSKEELRFIYQIDKKIGYFGYYPDPRIEEIISTRDQKKDLAKVFGCSPEEIALTSSEALKGKSLIYVGNLDLTDKIMLENVTLPTYLYGYLLLNNLVSATNLVLPKIVRGDVNLFKLKDIKGITLPKKVYGSLYLNLIESFEGLILPDIIESNLFLIRIPKIKDFAFPSKIGGNLNLRGLKEAENVKFPEAIEGSLNLSSLEKVENVYLPSRIKETLNLSSITNLNGLIFPTNLEIGKIIFKALSDQEIEQFRLKYPYLKIEKIKENN